MLTQSDEPQTKSLNDLDKLIEKDRAAAAIVAATVFNQQFTLAIHTIGEINIVASAQVHSDCVVSAAKLASDTEICAAELIANTEIAIAEIQRLRNSDVSAREIISSAVTEISHAAVKTIGSTAETAVQSINRQAELAIQQITANAKKSIDEIKAFANSVTLDIDASAREAKKKLETSKYDPRTPESANLAAQDAANRVLEAAAETTEKLDQRVKAAIKEINTAVKVARDVVAKVLSDAEKKILGTRDRAIERIHEFVAIKRE